MTQSPPVSRRPLVATRQGKIRGIVENGIARFLGIPYAAPPFGALRFERPRPHQPWRDEFDASAYGASPPQTLLGAGLSKLMRGVLIEGDDILNLNIWTPENAAEGSDLPVIFWIYGGALTRGCNALPLYDGSAFARDGVVFVGINYRVGVEGFAELEGAPDNRGLADCIAALEWVRDEIAGFGGDRSNITIIGQSAGGAMVSMLLGSPAARGLFSRAVIMSAAMGPGVDPPQADVAAAIAHHLGIPATRRAFAERTPHELAVAQTDVMGASAVSGGVYYHPVPGDDLLPQPLWQALTTGDGAAVPVIIGTATDEHRFWYVPMELEKSMTPELIDQALSWLGVDSDVLELYRRNRPDDSAAMAYGALSLDWICRVGMNMFADIRLARGERTWVYEFAWKSPVMNIGATHVVDLPFLFDILSTPDARMLVGDDPPQQLADDFHGAVLRFAKDDDPGWEPWGAHRPVMTWDAPRSAVTCAPREDERVALRRSPRFDA